jgi:NAD(P)-dependent dehydrogenase (short-subunit alcohol dehydrogenase family)
MGITKTYLNAVTIQHAKELSDTNVLINNAFPGYVATGLNAFSGTQTPSRAQRSQSDSRPFRTTARAADCSTTLGSSPGEGSPHF